MKKRFVAFALIFTIIIGFGWNRLTNASNVKEFTAKLIVNDVLINVGDIVELKYQYKINGQGKNISNVVLTHVLPSNFEVVELPNSKWNINGNTLKGIDLQSSDDTYEYTIKLKAKSIGKITDFGTASIEYNYNHGNDKTKDVVTAITQAYDKNNTEVKTLIVDTTNINIEATIKNKRTENGSSYIYLDEPLEVEYKLTPQGQINVERKPLDIVLVVDTSGSMQMKANSNHIYKYIIEKNYKMSGQWFKKIYFTDSKDEKEIYNDYTVNENLYYKSYDNQEYLNTKMYKSIEAAKYLINEIYNQSVTNNKEDKLTVVDFDSRVNNPNDSLMSIKENKDYLISLVDRMFGNGGTNIHEALLISEKHLNSDNRDVDKHIIVLTDGMPTYYLVGDKSLEYNTKYNTKIQVNGELGGNGSTVNNNTKNPVLNKIDNLKSMSKVHFVGLNTTVGDIDTEFFNTIKSKNAGISEIIDSTDKLKPLFEQIYQSITKSVVYSSITFEQQIPSQLSVDELYIGNTKLDSNQYTIENGKLIVNLDNIVFENKKGTPDPVTINVKYKPLDTGILNLGEAKINSKKLIEGMEFDYSNSCQIENIEIKPRDFFNYVSFNNIQANRNLIPNNTFATISIDLNKNDLFKMDSNAKVELVVTPVSDNKVEITRGNQQNIFVYNNSSSSKNEKYRINLTESDLKEKEISFRVTAIKVTYKGKEFNITQGINKYFGDNTPATSIMVKKFTLR